MKWNAFQKEVNAVTENKEMLKNLYVLFQEIAEREKKKAIETSDYGVAFISAILEGIFKEAVLTFQS